MEGKEERGTRAVGSRKEMTRLLMLMIITSLVRLEFVDTAVALLTEVAEEGLAGFAGGFGLFANRVGQLLVFERGM